MKNHPMPFQMLNPRKRKKKKVPLKGRLMTKKVVELQGMWDFILPQEVDQEVFPVSTRRKNQLDSPQTTSKQKSASPATKDKVTTKKTTTKATQSSPVQTDQTTPSKTLIVSDVMEYNIIDDMKRLGLILPFTN